MFRALLAHPQEALNNSTWHIACVYSGPSCYDRPDIRTTWVATKVLVLTYDQSLELRPECRSKPERLSDCAVVNKDLRCVRKRQIPVFVDIL
jgi:hypothetical protein